MLTAEVHVAGEHLVLHAHRALYWPRMRWVVVSDLHLGKAAHFRKAGVPLPEGQDVATLARLDGVIREFAPERVLILGDLFHSSHNKAWALFHSWAMHQTCALQLVFGNHDILADRRYMEAGVGITAGSLEVGPFLFAHEPEPQRGQYVIGGHVHPGISLRGRARQHMRLPCFTFGPDLGVLPAFGLSTGLFTILPGPTQYVFACTPGSVIDVTDIASEPRSAAR